MLRYHGISFDKILPLVIFFARYVVPNSLCIIRCLHSESAMQGIVVISIGTSRYMVAESPWSQSNWLQNQRLDLVEVQYMNDLMQRLISGLEWYRALLTMPFTNGAGVSMLAFEPQEEFW